MFSRLFVFYHPLLCYSLFEFFFSFSMYVIVFPGFLVFEQVFFRVSMALLHLSKEHLMMLDFDGTIK